MNIKNLNDLYNIIKKINVNNLNDLYNIIINIKILMIYFI